METAEQLRAQEVAEEREYAEESIAVDEKRRMLGRPLVMAHTAKMVRDWTLTTIIPDIILRTYETAMGVQTFSTPTAAGNVVEVEAPPHVQMAAAKMLIGIALPGQVGLVDSNGEELPGVLALGALDLDAARQQAHGERYVSPEAHARAKAAMLGEEGPAPLRPMAERIEAGEFEVVEVEEGVDTMHADEDRPPDPPPPPSAAVLRAREAARRRKEQSKIPVYDR